MKILVTGAAGFIGYHVSSRLLADGHEVVGIDNFNDYYIVSLKRDRHAILEKEAGYTSIEADLCDYDTVGNCFGEHSFDAVCHLAAQAGVRYSIDHPFAYQKSNLQAFLNVLEACRHAGTARLVYASSSSVYGGNTKLPFSESDSVDSPVSLYAATKKANELMAHTYSHLYNLQTVGLRFFTVYGPWGRPDMAAWLFVNALLEGRPIKVFNYGKMQRDFTFIDDIVNGVVASLTVPELDRYEVMNLGNHKPEELLDMIGEISRAVGVEPEMEMLPLQPGDVPSTYADIDRARVKLGFEPTIPISVGMPKFVEWYRDYHGI
ncbi:MAG: NAD-dependent epimerase/dehydratase family protein [Kiritimatiellia bacterium]|jgi:UDP-glucuronate 4-epimerase|nr:NAD-dependent epimerase/dehydratase family protein [Kiritimatiellia bacterium]MDP6848141.1 NAD-dependent epimerase/dehydratase family protein [Kiritimatiellia bacterium]